MPNNPSMDGPCQFKKATGRKFLLPMRLISHQSVEPLLELSRFRLQAENFIQSTIQVCKNNIWAVQIFSPCTRYMVLASIKLNDKTENRVSSGVSQSTCGGWGRCDVINHCTTRTLQEPVFVVNQMNGVAQGECVLGQILPVTFLILWQPC